MNEVPAIWKDLEEYDVCDAVNLWAHVFADFPLNCTQKERNNWVRELGIARKTLRDNVPIQKQPKPAAQPAQPRRASDWVHGWNDIRRKDEPDDAPRPAPKQAYREFFRGPDLAAYAAQRGKPGSFGFNKSDTVTTLSDPAPNAGNQTKGDDTLYKIIRALSLALAETAPDELKKDGKAWAGYSTGSGDKGIVGYLRTRRFSNLSGETLRKHIKRAMEGN